MNAGREAGPGTDLGHAVEDSLVPDCRAHEPSDDPQQDQGETDSHHPPRATPHWVKAQGIQVVLVAGNAVVVLVSRDVTQNP